MEGVKVEGAEMLECGHQNTLAHRIVKLGSLLLTCLPEINAITGAVWQDVFIQEVQIELKRHGLEDKAFIEMTEPLALEQKERVEASLAESLRHQVGKLMARNGGPGVQMPGVVMPVAEDDD